MKKEKEKKKAQLDDMILEKALPTSMRGKTYFS